MDINHQSLQEKPQAEAVRSQLNETLLGPPTLAEFKKGIKKSKKNSALGMSASSYNMLKSYPRDMVEYVYNLWRWFWNKPDTELPKSWMWHCYINFPKLCKRLWVSMTTVPSRSAKFFGRSGITVLSVALWMPGHIMVLEDIDHAYM
jgi:hypothetical protein